MCDTVRTQFKTLRASGDWYYILDPIRERLTHLRSLSIPVTVFILSYTHSEKYSQLVQDFGRGNKTSLTLRLQQGSAQVVEVKFGPLNICARRTRKFGTWTTTLTSVGKSVEDRGILQCLSGQLVSKCRLIGNGSVSSIRCFGTRTFWTLWTVTLRP